MSQRGWSGLSNGLRGLQRVIDLGEVDVRIAVVHERVQVVECFPDGHRLSREAQVVRFLLEHEVQRLVRVVLAVELADGVARGLVVIPECGCWLHNGGLSARM